MSIPFFRYAAGFLSQERMLTDAILDVFRRGAYIMQNELVQFESRLSAYLHIPNAVGVANCTDGMILALRAAGIGTGDEVIMPAHTFVATAAAAHFVGASPVLVDCGPDHLIDPAAIEGAITDRTAAIMPVHLNGRTCEMSTIQSIACAQGLAIIEDAAQALGARFRGRAAGTFGLAGAFSFYPAKLLGCLGDGGAVVTGNASIARELQLLRDHGRDEEGDVVAWGLNSRLDNVQAAILDLRLRGLDDEIERRRQIAQMYQDRLADMEELVLPPGPDDSDDRFDVFQNYEIESLDRDELREHLTRDGIGTILPWGGRAVHHYPKLGLSGDLPVTDGVFERCLLLPMNTSLTDDEVERVAASVRRFHANRMRAASLMSGAGAPSSQPGDRLPLA